MKDIILAGIAGAGKGTQARVLNETLGDKVQYFEVGAILRTLSNSDNMIGNYAKTYTSTGKLLPGPFIKGLLSLAFSCLQDGARMLVDGFPRMHAQKSMFDEAMADAHRDFMVYHLIVSEEEAMQRLQSRLLCSTCGTTYNTHIHGDIKYCPSDSSILKRRLDDQSIDAIRARFEAYHNETAPLLAEYKAEGKLIEINGMQSIEDVTAEIIANM